jgi:predicted PurR-regulated permease PerM
VRVHPLAVAVAVAIGTLAGSIIGAIIAVPIIALVNTVGSYLASTRERPRPDGPSHDHPSSRV